jgi:hypothetical protein
MIDDAHCRLEVTGDRMYLCRGSVESNLDPGWSCIMHLARTGDRVEIPKSISSAEVWGRP